MLDVQNPDIKVDELMQRIQEKIRLRRDQHVPTQVGAGAQGATDLSLMFNQLLAQVRDTAEVGVSLPPMSRTHGLKRSVATLVAKVFLRLAQLITREQRAFNQAVAVALQALVERLAHDSAQAAQATARLEELLANKQRRLEELDARIGAVEGTHGYKLDRLRTAVSLQERRLTMLLEEARKRLPKPLDAEQLQAFTDELPHVADAGISRSRMPFGDRARRSRSGSRFTYRSFARRRLERTRRASSIWAAAEASCSRCCGSKTSSHRGS